MKVLYFYARKLACRYLDLRDGAWTRMLEDRNKRLESKARSLEYENIRLSAELNDVKGQLAGYQKDFEAYRINRRII